MYRHSPQYEWVEWTATEEERAKPEFEDFTGFKIKIRSNPTSGEVRAESRLFAQIFSNTSAMDEYLQMIAARVVDWEYEMEDVTGEITSVPAPGVDPDNWVALSLLPPELSGWTITIVRNSHVPKSMTPTLNDVGNTAATTQNGSTQETMLPVS